MAEVLGKTRISFTASLRGSGKRRELRVGKNFVSVRSVKSERFSGQRLVVGDGGKGPRKANPNPPRVVSAKMGLAFRQPLKWWHKGLQPNMKEVTSAEDLVDSLAREGDKLIIVDFFSPGCGGCKALHPKICQFAEMNPEIGFLQVNYEEHKSMCYSLNVHVLPFFRFYRGAQGRLCSFSCTNATINKFKDALAKHTTERCSIGPTMGLDESELSALAANKDLFFSYTAKSLIAESSPASPKTHVPQSSKAVGHEGKTLVTA